MQCTDTVCLAQGAPSPRPWPHGAYLVRDIRHKDIPEKGPARNHARCPWEAQEQKPACGGLAQPAAARQTLLTTPGREPDFSLGRTGVVVGS